VVTADGNVVVVDVVDVVDVDVVDVANGASGTVDVVVVSPATIDALLHNDTPLTMIIARSIRRTTSTLLMRRIKDESFVIVIQARY